MFPWQQIKDQNNIVDVVGEYLQITQKSANYVAICPFHDDKNPSLTISPDKQIWHCFGCGAGGDCFGFVSQIESISKYEAALKLAKKVNFKLPKNLQNKAQNQTENQSKLIKNQETKTLNSQSIDIISTLDTNLENPHQNVTPKSLSNFNNPISDYQKGLQYLNLAKRLYHQNLLQILKNPQHFVSIYCQKRGLTLDIIQKFEIGFASPNCDILRLSKKYNLDQKILLQTGLFKKLDKKNLTKKE